MKSLTHQKFFFLLIDFVLIFFFAGIGRHSHGEGLQGIVPQRIFPAGILVWLNAVFGGQLLRVLMGGSTALSFIVVTTIALGIFLLGWRAIFLLIQRKRGEK